jgi:hypothetical protein
MVICDTSGLIALVDSGTPEHKAVRDALARATLPFVISPLVLAEFDYLIRRRGGDARGRNAVRKVLTSGFEIATLSQADLIDAVYIDDQYADLSLGLTDASIVVLAARYGTIDILTLDERHFRAVRPRHDAQAFRLLPADG